MGDVEPALDCAGVDADSAMWASSRVRIATADAPTSK